MSLLESGPARFDRNYLLVIGIVCVALAGYFVYDGAYGYYQDNRQEAETELARWTTLSVDELGKSLTRQDFEQLRASSPTTRDQVRAALGEPLPPKDAAARPDNVERFASIYGMAVVPFTPTGRVSVRGMQWQPWGHSRDEIDTQYYWALVPGLIALYFFVRVYRAATLRAAIDEEGMTYGGRRIAFAEMVSLRDYNRKGWVDLYYRAGEREKRLRIDNQKIARFDEIAELICEKKGFANPIKAAEEERDTEEEEGGQAAD